MSWCFKCAAPGTGIELMKDGVSIGERTMCDACFAGSCRRFELARQEFAALIAAGVSNEEANRIMISKIEKRSNEA